MSIVQPFDPDDPSTGCYDHLCYRSMAYNWLDLSRPELNRLSLDDHRMPPYAYRIVAPFLARLLGLPFSDDISRGFYLLTVLSLAITTVLVGLIVYLASHRLINAVLAVAVFGLHPWLTGFNLWDYMLPDPLAYALIAVAALALIRHHLPLFLVACLVGLFVKEVFVFVLPAYAIYEYLNHRPWQRSLILACTLLLPYGLFRLLAPVSGTYSLAVYLHPVSLRMLQALIFTFGPLYLLAIVWLRQSRLAIAFVPLALGAAASTLFITDTERVLVYAFPVVLFALFAQDPPSLQLPQTHPRTPQ